jgi:oligosaccharide repeat unit polymerase
MAGVALAVLAAAYALGAIFGIWRYRTPLNPLSFTSVVQGGITVLSGLIVYSQMATAPYTTHDASHTAVLALVAFAGTVTPYLFRGGTPSGVFRAIMRVTGLDSERIGTRFSYVKFGLLLGAAVLSFVALAVVGGGGLRWLTDTRSAYINNRSGAGPFFAAFQWFLVFALAYYLWSRRPTHVLSILLAAVPFTVAASFSGSKSNILTVLVFCTAYYHFRVRAIPLAVYLLMIPAVLGLFSWLLVIQGFQPVDALPALVYFKDYFDTTSQFLSRFDEFGFRYGAATFSELWAYVPRGLYPAKPYEYGLTLVHQVLFPGFAQTGNTPGILFWATSYLDFGVFGVFLWGVLGSLWQRAAYEYYLSRRRSLFGFLLMLQFALWAPLPFATAAMALTLCLFISLYLRLTVRSTRAPRRQAS